MKEAFLKAIRANPADNLPRLVYADWLEENGEPEYAEYIRFAVAHAREIAVEMHPYHTIARIRMTGILNKTVKSHSPRWIRIYFNRGFASSVRLCWEAKLKKFLPFYYESCLNYIEMPDDSMVQRVYENPDQLASFNVFINLDRLYPYRKELEPSLRYLAEKHGRWVLEKDRIVWNGEVQNSYQICRQMLSDAAILTLKRYANESG